MAKKAGLDDLLMPERQFLFNTPVPTKLHEIVNAVIGSSGVNNLKMYVLVEKDDFKTELFFNPSDIIDYNLCRVFFVRNEAEAWRKNLKIIHPNKNLIILDAKFNELYPFFVKCLTLDSSGQKKISLSMEYEKDILDIEIWTKETFTQLN